MSTAFAESEARKCNSSTQRPGIRRNDLEVRSVIPSFILGLARSEHLDLKPHCKTALASALGTDGGLHSARGAQRTMLTEPPGPARAEPQPVPRPVPLTIAASCPSQWWLRWSPMLRRPMLRSQARGRWRFGSSGRRSLSSWSSSPPSVATSSSSLQCHWRESCKMPPTTS